MKNNISTKAPATSSPLPRAPFSLPALGFGLVWALALAFGAGSAVADTAAESDPPSEQLVIFTQSPAGASSADPFPASDLARRFADEHLPAILETAEELEIPVEVVDVGKAGAPPEIHLTPLVVHQNARGRSFFQGRYADAGKVAHFVRTSRAIPPVDGAQTKKDILVMELGRAKIVSPVKITSPNGHPPLDLDPAAFRAAAEKALLHGLERYERRDRVELGPSDRAFYFDLYPYISEDGQLYVSTALFSQFNCIEPVYTNYEEPVSGPLAERDRVFAEAARALETEVLRQLAESPIGDGFDPVPETVAEVGWEELGLPLPEAASGVDAEAAAGIELGREWRMAESTEDDGPRLVFRFPFPLERYSGEVTELDGRLELGEGLALEGASGRLEVKTGSVTMGESSLDNAIHTKMIHVADFPTASFELGKMAAGSEPIAFGRLSRFVARGTFGFMGKTVPVEVRGQVEPLVAEDGQPRLHVIATFQIRLADPFGVEGPDGPLPARDTLDFFLDFQLRPAD